MYARDMSKINFKQINKCVSQSNSSTFYRQIFHFQHYEGSLDSPYWTRDLILFCFAAPTSPEPLSPPLSPEADATPTPPSATTGPGAPTSNTGNRAGVTPSAAHPLFSASPLLLLAVLGVFALKYY